MTDARDVQPIDPQWLKGKEPPPGPEDEEICLCCGGSGTDIMADGSSRPCPCKIAKELA